MKKLLNVLMAIIVFAATSCSVDDDDTEYYQYRLGHIEGSSATSFTILTDGGYRLKPIDFASSSYEIKNGQRVLVQFAIVSEEKEESDVDYKVKVGYIEDVPVKEIITANEEVRDSIGNDPVSISALSTGNGYLNVQFSFYGEEAANHYLYMVYDEEKQEKTDFLTLDFHHNANNDVKLRSYSGMFSFPLQQFEEGENGTLKILFRSKREDNSLFTHEIEYKYGDAEEEEE